jgi:hypothetical protein
VIDPASHAAFASLVRRQAGSLLQYIRDSYPWTTPAEEPALARVKQLAADEEHSTQGLIRFLRKRRVTPPATGSYPSGFTTINFISFKHLVPMLTEYERSGIATVEKQMGDVADGEVRHLFHEVLEMKRRHLHALEHLDEQPAEKPVEAAAAHH